MEVLVAPQAGFCFGVKRAVDLALTAARESRGPLYSLGELIHNKQVVAELEQAGVRVAQDLEGITEGTVVIRSHGLDPRLQAAAAARGLKIVDATCPFVRRAQKLAQVLTQEGYQVIIVGERGHPEVDAILGATGDTATVVAGPEELAEIALGPKVGIVAQTTQSQANLEACAAAAQARAAEVKVCNTICNTTAARQASAVELAGQVDRMLVIGGHHSANTRRLAEVCAATGVPTFHLEDPAELQAWWLAGAQKVGVTAGASTPNWMIEGVIRRMMDMAEKVLEIRQEEEQQAPQTGAATPEQGGGAEPERGEPGKLAELSPEKGAEAGTTAKPDLESQTGDGVEKEAEPEPELAGVPPAEPNRWEENPEPTPEQTRMEVEAIPTINRGDVITGKVIQVTDDEVMVDIGYKSEGIIPKNELAFRPVGSAREVVSVGDEIQVYVERIEDQEGNPVLSKRKADARIAWEKLERAKAEGTIIEAPVVERVKGGLLVDVGVRGFVPASQATINFTNNLEQFIGQVWRLKVLEIDRKRSNVVLSHRLVLEEEFKQKKEEVYNSLEAGQVREGEVKRLTDFGAFVDIGSGVEGLLHVSELSYSRVRHPRDVVREGQKIKVLVLGVDREHDRISLGYKQLQPDPWKDIATKYPVGAIVTGKVTRLVDFGAFVQLEDGVEGLVHISQLSHRHVSKPGEVVKPGETVNVKVLSVDEDKRRIGLSIREATPKEELEVGTDNRNEKPKEGNVTLGDLFGDLFEQAGETAKDKDKQVDSQTENQTEAEPGTTAPMDEEIGATAEGPSAGEGDQPAAANTEDEAEKAVG